MWRHLAAEVGKILLYTFLSKLFIFFLSLFVQRGMVEAPKNGKESSHCAPANGIEISLFVSIQVSYAYAEVSWLMFKSLLL
jgi:hypothetical protein